MEPLEKYSVEEALKKYPVEELVALRDSGEKVLAELGVEVPSKNLLYKAISEKVKDENTHKLSLINQILTIGQELNSGFTRSKAIELVALSHGTASLKMLDTLSRIITFLEESKRLADYILPCVAAEIEANNKGGIKVGQQY